MAVVKQELWQNCGISGTNDSVVKVVPDLSVLRHTAVVYHSVTSQLRWSYISCVFLLSTGILIPHLLQVDSST